MGDEGSAMSWQNSTDWGRLLALIVAASFLVGLGGFVGYRWGAAHRPSPPIMTRVEDPTSQHERNRWQRERAMRVYLWTLIRLSIDLKTNHEDNGNRAREFTPTKTVGREDPILDASRMSTLADLSIKKSVLDEQMREIELLVKEWTDEKRIEDWIGRDEPLEPLPNGPKGSDFPWIGNEVKTAIARYGLRGFVASLKETPGASEGLASSLENAETVEAVMELLPRFKPRTNPGEENRFLSGDPEPDGINEAVQRLRIRLKGLTPAANEGAQRLRIRLEGLTPAANEGTGRWVDRRSWVERVGLVVLAR